MWFLRKCAMPLALACLAAALGSCRTRGSNERASVTAIGGLSLDAKALLASHTVAILDDTGQLIGSGSLAAPDTVIAAAHVFAFLKPTLSVKYFAFFGQNISAVRLEGEEKLDVTHPQLREITQVHLHEDFEIDAFMPANPVMAPPGLKYAWGNVGSQVPGRKGGDLAALKLAEVAPSSHTPAPLRKKPIDFAAGTELVSLGFGRGLEGVEEGKLNYIFITLDEHRDEYREFVASGVDGASPFFGDSGGPVFHWSQTNGWVQVGMVSRPARSNEAPDTKKGMFSALSGYSDWIQTATRSDYCTEYRVSRKTRERKEGYVDYETGKDGVEFRGQNVLMSVGRKQVWSRLQPGDKLKRFIKYSSGKGGYFANLDMNAITLSSTVLRPKNREGLVLGHVETFFVESAGSDRNCVD